MRPLTSSSHFEFFIGSGSFAMLNAIVRASSKVIGRPIPPASTDVSCP